VDLAAPSCQNPATLKRLFRGYVDDVAGFNGKRWGDVVIAPSDITFRKLQVAIPSGAWASGQAAAMSDAFQYGLQEGVQVEFVVVR
jgi:hypothetical protein